MIELKLTGNTFGIKDTLKNLGFRWNGKNWIKNFKDSEETTANELATRWINEGVYGTLKKEA